MPSIVDALEPLGIKISNPPYKSYKCVVPLSGGKDSQACLKLAIKQYGCNEVMALFCDTEFEHEITYKHISRIAKEYKIHLTTLNSGSVYSVCIKYKRLPGGGARHCTDELKIRPSKFFYKEFSKRFGGFEVWYGMRSGESAQRKKRYENKVDSDIYAPHEIMPRKYPKYLFNLGVMFRLPILEWSTDEVLSFLWDQANPLYSAGFDRVGCFPCLASGDKHMHKAFNYDAVGKRHFEIATKILSFTPKDSLFNTERFKGGGCLICSM